MHQNDSKLLNQLYSKLKIKPHLQHKTNPIIVLRPQSNLIAKSFANKIHNVKKNKIKLAINLPKKQSAHSFTCFGIVSQQTYDQNFGMIKSERRLAHQAHQKQTEKFLKYENKCFYAFSQRTKKLSLRFKTQCDKKESLSKCFPQQQKQLTCRNRAKSAHYSRKPKLQAFDLTSHRKISDNLNFRSFHENQINGWDIGQLGEANELFKN